MKTLAFLLALILAAGGAYACTGFVFSDGETVYAGGNDDFRYSDFYIWFEPATGPGEYGSVFIGWPLWH